MTDEIQSRFVLKGIGGITVHRGKRNGVPLLRGRSARFFKTKSHTVTALFDKRSDAQAAENLLKASSVSAGNISIHDKTTDGFNATGASTPQELGMWASIKNAFLPDEDRHIYEEGVRRGGFLLTADVNEDQVDAAVRVLEEADTVDIDDRSEQWRSTGWDYSPPAAMSAGALSGAAMGAGAATATSAFTDRPVVGTDADDAFRERTIHVTATGEEAVVGKTARVVEEVVISKTAGERVEEINEIVRRTDVGMDEDKSLIAKPGNRC